jgi:hypothetical protein
LHFYIIHQPRRAIYEIQPANHFSSGIRAFL